MGIINGNKIATSTYVLDGNGYYRKEEMPAVVGGLVSNPNLLINGDFRVNQRGLPSYTGSDYTVDRWKSTSGTLEVLTNGIKFSASAEWIGILQKIEYPSKLAGRTVTLSLQGYVESGNTLYAYLLYQKKGGSKVDLGSVAITSTSNQIVSVTGNIPSDVDDADSLYVQLYNIKANSAFYCNWVKLEIGSVATAFSPRPYAEELALCQRYYYRVTADTFYGTIMECFCKLNSTTEASGFIKTPVTMRPYISVGWGGNIRGYVGNQTVTQIGYDQWSSLGVRFNVVINNANALPFYYLMGNNDKTAYVYIDAEM